MDCEYGKTVRWGICGLSGWGARGLAAVIDHYADARGGRAAALDLEPGSRTSHVWHGAARPNRRFAGRVSRHVLLAVGVPLLEAVSRGARHLQAGNGGADERVVPV